MRRTEGFPILRVLGGALLVLAGLFAFYGVGLGVAGVLILVGGGAVVLVAVALGSKFRRSDFALFTVGILVLGAVTVGYPVGAETTTYSATRAQVPQPAISLTVSADVGSVSVGFTSAADVAYQVTFTRDPWMTSLEPAGTDTMANSSANGVFALGVASTWSSVAVLIGSGYPLDVTATTGTGSVQFDANGEASLGNVTLRTSTGSVNVALHSATIRSLSVTTGTGSVNFASSALKAAGPSTPISITASTGSVNVNAVLASQDAVSLSATTSLGSISHTLSGFTVTEETGTTLRAAAGDPQSAPFSFAMAVTTSLGSVHLDVGFA